MKEQQAIDFDELIAFLTGLGLDVNNEQQDGKFNRNILVNTQFGKFNIEWYKNMSTISDINGSFTYKFMFVYKDMSYPERGNWIGFSPIKYRKNSIFDREYPFEIFRLKY